jgi:predicted SprT family Zn-dependent metalloprotease
MMKRRDNKRKRVYDAEHVVFKEHRGYSYLLNWKETLEFIERIKRSRWFYTYYITDPLTGRPLHTPKDRFNTRGLYVADGRGTSTAFADRNHINLPKNQRFKWVILHELSHWLQSPGARGHGRQFRRIFIDLVKRWIGPDEAKRLTKEFRKRKCRIGYAAITKQKSSYSIEVSCSVRMKGVVEVEAVTAVQAMDTVHLVIDPSDHKQQWKILSTTVLNRSLEPIAIAANK